MAVAKRGHLTRVREVAQTQGRLNELESMIEAFEKAIRKDSLKAYRAAELTLLMADLGVGQRVLAEIEREMSASGN